MKFEEFVRSDRDRSHVLYDAGNLRMWMRKATFRRQPVMIDIANMEASEPGRGSLTRFLDEFEAIGVYVETVSDMQLARYFLNRGYTMDGRMPGASFYLPTMRMHLTAAQARIVDAIETFRSGIQR